jgi:hypothetical protein
MRSKVPITETDEATAATNVPLDLRDGDGDGVGVGVGAGEPGKQGLRRGVHIEINNIPSSMV